MSRALFTQLIELPARGLNLLHSPFALLVRWYVSWQFLKSGWLKLSDWTTTLDLFRNEYHVPVLPPGAAAVAGTMGELFFPVLLVVGLGGRLPALGLFAVNLMAVISYSHVLLSEGFEAAIGQHVLWGFMLATLAINGNGAFSIDRLLLKGQRLSASNLSMA